MCVCMCLCACVYACVRACVCAMCVCVYVHVCMRTSVYVRVFVVRFSICSDSRFCCLQDQVRELIPSKEFFDSLAKREEMLEQLNLLSDEMKAAREKMLVSTACVLPFQSSTSVSTSQVLPGLWSFRAETYCKLVRSVNLYPQTTLVCSVMNAIQSFIFRGVDPDCTSCRRNRFETVSDVSPRCGSGVGGRVPQFPEIIS